MKKILVTGGAGFIGYHISNKLSEDSNNEVVIVDNLHRGRMDSLFSTLISKPNVRFVKEDLTDIGALKKTIWEDFDEIYHLAAIIGVKHCMNHPDEVLRVNLISTLNIVQLAKEHHVGKIVFASTCETYAGCLDYGIISIPTTEDIPLMVADTYNPRLTYASSKIANEQMIIFNAPGHYDYSIIRYHNIYGQREGFAHVIPEILVRIVRGENPLKVYGADQTRSFCHVYDGANQTIAVMNSDKTNGKVVNIGETNEITIRELVDRMLHILNKKVTIEDVPAPMGSVRRRCPDVSRLTKLTGVKSQISLDEGLKMTIDWYLDLIKAGDIWE